jgi:hypothetical protein
MSLDRLIVTGLSEVTPSSASSLVGKPLRIDLHVDADALGQIVDHFAKRLVLEPHRDRRVELLLDFDVLLQTLLPSFGAESLSTNRQVLPTLRILGKLHKALALVERNAGFFDIV